VTEDLDWPQSFTLEMSLPFHLRGRHVQHAHGRRAELAGGEHTGCGMVALMPTEADAKRLKLPGGETADELHLTLFFLGCDMDTWTQDDKVSTSNQVMDAVASLGPVTLAGNVFGVNHWNGNGDSPCWVLGVGDIPSDDRPEDGTTLEAVRGRIFDHLLDGPEFAAQHTPWSPHICMAYTGDLSLAKELQRRLGPVEFDRVRVAFGGEWTDIPLSGSLTAAAAPLRRNLTDIELSARTDFARMQDAWTDTVDAVLSDLEPVFEAQREDIVAQVSVAAKADDLDALEQVTVDEDAVYEVLRPHLLAAAQAAAEAQQEEAEAQGVTVPEWSFSNPPEVLTAAVGRDLLDSVARVTAQLMSTSLVQSAVRTALRLFGRGTTPELVTAGVEDHLNELTDAGPRDAVGGAVTQAQNEGRRTVLAVAPPGRYFASEVLDRNSCKPCRDIDGTEYSSLGRAMVAYPSGGYRNCLGGSRCRGTIVTVWSEDAGATASAVPIEAEDQGMPWTVVENHGECGSDEPFAVVKEGTGEVEGCHATREEAEEQMAALYASEDGDTDGISMDYAASTAPWTGPLAVEGIVTGDGREFASGALTWADLPVPLRWNKEDSHGGEPHTVAVNVGRIDEIWRDGGKIMGSGVLNLAEPDGQRVYNLIKGQFLRGVSIDADSISDADVELVWPEGDSDETDEDDPLAMLFGGPPPEKMIFHAGRIRAATLVDIPAFAEAYIALTDDTGAIVAGGRPYQFGAIAEHDTATSEDSWDAGENEKRLPSPLTLAQVRAAYAWFDDASVEDGELPKTGARFLHHEINADGSAGPANLAACSAAIGALHGARGGTTIPDADRRGVYDHVAAHLRDAGMEPEPFSARGAVTAAVSIDDHRPPLEWFEDPKLAGYTGIVVTDEGRVYGHVAPWNACHIGYDGECVTAPREDVHDHYMTGEVVCSDGGRAQVGQITIGTGHASLYMSAKPAADHYDNTGTAVADVAVGNDKHGIWLAGAIRPGADPQSVFELRAAGRVSGDWRRIGGKLRLVALLGVNVAGFQGDTRTRARVAGGQPMALVAAGLSAPVWHPESMDLKRAYRVIMDDLYARVNEGR
jgi:hypothetical protein